jgi:hypothetical protein
MTALSPPAEATGVRLWVPIALFLLLLVPLALTPVIPSVDFNDHLLRYWVLADAGATSHLARNYSPDWGLLSNLGMDVIGTGILMLMSPLAAGKLVAAIVLAAPFLGTLYLAHAVQGRITLVTVLLAGMLGFSHIFTWGFTNFLLGIGLLLLGIGWWIRMRGRPGVQLAGAMLLGVVLVLVHALAFGLWGLMLGMTELGIAFAGRRPTLGSLVVRGVRLGAVAVAPVALFLSSRTAEAPQGVTAAVGNLGAHADKGGLVERVTAEALSRIDLLLRVSDSLHPMADRLIGGLLWAVILFGLWAGAVRLAPLLRLPIALALLLVLVAPPNMFGSGYVNDRMPLLLMALVVAALAPSPRYRFQRGFVLAVGALFAAHFALVVAGYAAAGRHFQAYLDGLAGKDTREIAVTLQFSGSGRSENLPLCSPLMPLLAFAQETAVPTFATPSQQPLVLDGRLLAATEERSVKTPRAERRSDQQLTDPAIRADRIASQFGFGFDTVVTCDAAGPVPSDARITRIAAGPFWGVYRKAG